MLSYWPTACCRQNRTAWRGCRFAAQHPIARPGWWGASRRLQTQSRPCRPSVPQYCTGTCIRNVSVPHTQLVNSFTIWCLAQSTAVGTLVATDRRRNQVVGKPIECSRRHKKMRFHDVPFCATFPHTSLNYSSVIPLINSFLVCLENCNNQSL
jgi:hypothetical protein